MFIGIGVALTNVALLAGGGGPAPVVVSAPNVAFAYSPVTISRIGSGSSSTFTTNYSEASRKALITPVTTFYVRKAGSNNNDGLTAGTAFRSMRLAVKMGVDTGQPFKVNYEAALPGATPVLYLDTNTQARSGQATNNATWGECWRSTDLTQDCILEPSVAGGVAFNIPNISKSTFTSTADANIYQSSMNARHVYDFANLDSKGNPRRLALLSTVPADVNAPWPELNALYAATSGVTDGGTVSAYAMGVCYKNASNVLFVRMFDNRNPNADANVYVMGNTGTWTAPGIAATPAKAINGYIEGMRFIGFEVSGRGPFVLLAAGGFRHRFDFVRCGFLGGNGAGTLEVKGTLDTDGSDTIAVDCQASYGTLDGYNYHQACTAIEIDCEALWNGYDTGLANNGSTLHETSKGIRVNGRYIQGQDRALHDVADSYSWNLGCKAGSRRGSDASEQSAAFASGHPTNTGVTTRMWLDACKVLDGPAGPPQYPTECYVTSFLYYANMDFTPTAGPGVGTVAAYTP